MKLLLKAKKSLGQNFLIDNNIINKIVDIGNIDKNKTIVEIGAGYGNLTKAIASVGPKKIFAIEKDKKLVSLLKKELNFYLFQLQKFFLDQSLLSLVLNFHNHSLFP